MSYATRIVAKALRRFQAWSCRSEISLSIKYPFQLPLALNSTTMRLSSTDVLAEPTPSNEEKQYSKKIVKIAEEITKLTLIEVNELNNLLIKTLNIRETPMMAYGAMPAATAAPSTAPQDEEEEVKPIKSSFTVKLIKFSPDKKIALIKEIKNLIEGMNLVQAKKFVESVPQVIRGDISKEEAESLKKVLETAGGECDID